MDVIFQGKRDTEETGDSLLAVLRLFKEQYHINQFRELRLSLTLVDDRGDDVELVDTDTGHVYRVFEVCTREPVALSKTQGTPKLKLVVDNT